MSSNKLLAIVGLVLALLTGAGFLADSLRQRPGASKPAAEPIAAAVPSDHFTFQADWNADTCRDPDALEQYQQAAGEALQREEFDTLDRTADTARVNILRFCGGTWKLLELYRGVTRPLSRDYATEQDWQSLLKNLESWTAKKPGSITARIALADATLEYGFFARGSDSIGNTRPADYRTFKDRTAKARGILEEAHKLPVDCPHWYSAMLQVALQAEWKAEDEKKLFEKAIAYEPTYYTYYRQRALYLEPRWNGEPGEMEAFAKSAADRIGGDEGDRVYFEIAASCNCGGNDRLKSMSWTRIKHGYEVLQEKYGASLVKMNQMAFLASHNSDPLYAVQLLDEIGNRWSKDTWEHQKAWEEEKIWAQKVRAPGGAWPIAARANLGSQAGRTYAKQLDAEFARKYASVYADCRAQAGDQLRAFEMYVEVNADGTLANLAPAQTNVFSRCVLPKITKTAALVKPPRPAYWVRVPVADR